MFKLIRNFFILLSGTLLTLNYSFGFSGFLGQFVAENAFVFIPFYIVLVSHVTITAMSLSFHRYHTHKGVILNKTVDMMMQIWLWMVTSLSKVDWVSVHIWHHAHSDKEKDPHSPLQKGLLHALFFGVFDYTKAKSWPEVEKIKKTLPTNHIEAYIHAHSFVGPTILTIFNLLVFGLFWGAVISMINFVVSPIFAVGGVNALAHWWGYKNHPTSDNSRNLGFIFPLNFIICGELDHNNHHAHMRSCSFRHRWFEFDIGYVYLKILSFFKLAELKNVYSPATLKEELAKKFLELIEKDNRFKIRFEELAREMNLSYMDFKKRVEAYYLGERVKFEKSAKLFMDEVKRTYLVNQKLKFSYSN